MNRLLSSSEKRRQPAVKRLGTRIAEMLWRMQQRRHEQGDPNDVGRTRNASKERPPGGDPSTAVEIDCAGTTRPSSDRRASSHGPHAHGTQIAPLDPNASRPHESRLPHWADRHRSRVYASTRVHGRRPPLMHRWWTWPTNLHRSLRLRGPWPIASSCSPPSRLPVLPNPAGELPFRAQGARNLEPVPNRSNTAYERWRKEPAL
jgi:hypothetical protein